MKTPSSFIYRTYRQPRATDVRNTSQPERVRTMLNEPNPNNFVDVDEAFEDDYDPDRITLATFDIIHSGGAKALLEYNERGFSFLGGSGGPKWAINLYASYHYNGQALPLHDPDEPRHVLETLSGTDDLVSYDWAAQDWTYFE